MHLMEVASLGSRSKESAGDLYPSHARMLFHGLPRGEVQVFIDAMDQTESTAISSTINMGERDTKAITRSGGGAIQCAGCDGKISDRYYLRAVDKQWHTGCLKCCECKLNLASELSCFSKDSSIFCKEDYYRRFSVQRCARCHLGISALEMVMRARDSVYHLDCFTCTSCNKILTTGDHFGMKDGLVYCRLHFQTLVEEGYHSHVYLEDVSPFNRGVFDSLGLSYYNGLSSVQRGRQRRRKNTGKGADQTVYSAALTCRETDSSVADGDSSLYSTCHKSKRVRTSFKHHQLRAMKSYFAINHNPDAKDLKQLSQKTGLTKRVLQVWFQNARAKFRRNVLYQENTGADGPMLPAGASAGLASDISNTSMSPCSTPPATLTDLPSPPLSGVTSMPGGLDLSDSGSPSHPSMICLI